MVEHDNRVKYKPKGRPKGSINRSTRELRQAIGNFVGTNAQRFNEWLSQVASGIPKVDANGKVIRDSQGSVVWVNRPDPGQAMKLVGDLAEYFIPKLSRQEVDVRSIHATLDNLSPFAQSLLSEPADGSSSSSLADRLRSLARQDDQQLPTWLQPAEDSRIIETVEPIETVENGNA